MKKILSALIALYLLVPASYGQEDEIRPKALGISFFVNDFVTPARIRSSSLVKVLADKKLATLQCRINHLVQINCCWKPPLQ